MSFVETTASRRNVVEGNDRPGRKRDCDKKRGCTAARSELWITSCKVQGRGGVIGFEETVLFSDGAVDTKEEKIEMTKVFTGGGIHRS